MVLELSFRARDTACCISMQVCLAYCGARVSFNTILRREAISRSVNLLRDLSHAVNRMFVKHLIFSSGMLIARFTVLISTPRYVRTQEHVFLKYLSIES